MGIVPLCCYLREGKVRIFFELARRISERDAHGLQYFFEMGDGGWDAQQAKK